MEDLAELGAVELLEAVRRQNVSCEQVMAASLDRIEASNSSVNAIVSLRSREELLAEARDADQQEKTLPLHGIPIAIKDLADTRGIRTTYGSPIFSDNIPENDSLMVARIRAAGAIIIGKTNTPEYGLGSQSYNPVHGATCNPYDLTKTAGGSSGGAAAALACRMLPLADGSDMMGSLRNPAAFCNVYGFRPSFGLVPGDLSGEVFLHQLSTNGPMARSVLDLALLLDVISGPEPGSPYSLPAQPSFLEALSPDPGKLRIGWLGNWAGYYPMHPEIPGLCEEALEVFRSQGHEVTEIRPDFDPESLWLSWTRLRSFNIADSLGPHYEIPEERTQLKPEAIYEIESGRALTVDDIKEASLIRSRWFACMAKIHRSFDAVVLPSAQVFPFDAETHWPDTINDRKMTTYHKWMEVVIPASLIGLPAINVPVGFSASGLPMGMQIVAKRGDDQALLNLAHAYHQATNWPDVKPKFTAE